MWSSLAEGFKEFADVVSKDAQEAYASVSKFAYSGEPDEPGSPGAAFTADDFVADRPPQLPASVVRDLQHSIESFTTPVTEEESREFTPRWIRVIASSSTTVDDAQGNALGAQVQQSIFEVASHLLRNSTAVREQFRNVFGGFADVDNHTLESLEDEVLDFRQSGPEASSPAGGAGGPVVLPSQFFIHYFVRLNRLLVKAERERRTAALAGERSPDTVAARAVAAASAASSEDVAVLQKTVLDLQRENAALRDALADSEMTVSQLRGALRLTQQQVVASSTAASPQQQSSTKKQDDDTNDNLEQVGGGGATNRAASASAHSGSAEMISSSPSGNSIDSCTSASATRGGGGGGSTVVQASRVPNSTDHQQQEDEEEEWTDVMT